MKRNLSLPMGSLMLLVIGMILTASPAVASINILVNQTDAFVSDADGGFVIDSKFDLPGATAFASLPGFSSETTSVAGSSGLSMSYDQVRQGGQNDLSLGQNYIEFTASADAMFSISGSFTNSGGEGQLYVSLYNVNSGLNEFLNYQVHNGATSLTLGNTSGNLDNLMEGSLTGSLVAGNKYVWFSYAYTQADLNGDGGASASGSVQMQLSQIPEPGSLLVWTVIGLVAMPTRRKLRK